MNRKVIEFIYDKTLKRPKKLQNNVFMVYSPEKIRLHPGEFKKVDMKLSIRLQEQIVTTCILLPSFSKNGLKLENCQYISADNNLINLNQPINLPWKLQFKLVSRSKNTIFSICKRQEIGYIVPLNEEIEQLKVKYTKT